jgi:hypothetical protein
LWQREERDGGQDGIVLSAFSDTNGNGIIGRQKQKQQLSSEAGGSEAVDALEQACF